LYVLSQSLLVFVAVLDGSGFNLANEWDYGRDGRVLILSSFRKQHGYFSDF
jgi:hypothetical protein